jgi:hypothetical protein
VLNEEEMTVRTWPGDAHLVYAEFHD